MQQAADLLLDAAGGAGAAGGLGQAGAVQPVRGEEPVRVQHGQRIHQQQRRLEEVVDGEAHGRKDEAEEEAGGGVVAQASE